MTGFVATYVIAHELGADVLGTYTLVLALITWGEFPTNGIGAAVSKRMSEGTDRGEYASAGFLLSGAVLCVLLLSILLFRTRINALVDRDVARMMLLLASGRVLFQLGIQALQGQKLVIRSGAVQASERLVRTVLQIGTIVLGYGLTTLFYSFGVSLAVGTFLAFVLSVVRPSVPKWRHVTSLVEYARYSWLAGLRWQTFTWMDTIVLAFFVNRTLIGVYEVSWNLATVLALISVSIRRTLFPEMSELGVTEDYGRIKHYLTEGLSFAGIFAIPGFFGALVVGPRLLSIYGPAFQRGAVVLLVLILVRLVATYESLFLSTLNAIDHPDTTFRINVLFIVTNVSLNVLLVWLFGWIGAAVASLVAMSVALVANYIALTALIGAPSLPFGDIVYEVVAAASMAFVLRVLLSRVPASTFTTILLVGFGAVVYLTVLVGLSPTVREKAVSLV